MANRTWKAIAAAVTVAFSFVGHAHGQGAMQQAGPVVPGHPLQFLQNGIAMDGGAAAGGNINTTIGELGLTMRSGNGGQPPFAGTGTGQFGTNFCDYDAPTNNATGFHVLCVGPNALGGGLISYSAGGSAAPLPFQLNINGQSIVLGGTNWLSNLLDGNFGAAPGTILCRGSSAWLGLSAGTSGQLLQSVGATACPSWVSIGIGNVSGPGSSTNGFLPTWVGTGGNLLGTGVAAPSSAVVGISDSQTLTNKTISGTANTLSNVGLSSLGSIGANTIVGNATAFSASPTALSVPSCSGAGQALNWTASVGPGCATFTSISGPGSSTSGFVPLWSGTGGNALGVGVAAPAGAIVGTSDNQTLTNKSISGSANTITNIGVGSLASVAANTVLGNFSGASAVPAANSVPNCTGAGSGLQYTSAVGFSCGTVSAVTVTGTHTTGDAVVWNSSSNVIQGAGKPIPIPVTSPAYGALCDGVTDDTSAFASAIAANSGGAISIPENVICIVRPLNISVPITIIGDPLTSHIKLKPGNYASTSLLNILSSNVTIRGGVWDYNIGPVTGTNGAVIEVNTTSNVIIDGVTVPNASGTVLIYGIDSVGSSGVTIKNVNITGNAGGGLIDFRSISGDGATAGLIALNNNVTVSSGATSSNAINFSDAGAGVGNPMGDIQVVGNQVSMATPAGGTLLGIQFFCPTGGELFFGNTTIANNVVTGGSYGISNTCANNSTVSGNAVAMQAVYGIESNCVAVTVSGNSVFLNSGASAGIILDGPSSCVTGSVTGNTIRGSNNGPGQTGIAVQTQQFAVISSNTVTNCGNGIVVNTANDFVITNNILANQSSTSGGVGILIENGSNGTIGNNLVAWGLSNGIELSQTGGGTVATIVISGNYSIATTNAYVTSGTVSAITKVNNANF